jgi:hypothetical protein
MSKHLCFTSAASVASKLIRVSCGFVLTIALGCSPAGSSVQGQVSLAGAPLDEATISFVPVEPETNPPAWANVSRGQYAIAPTDGLKPGKYRVEIRALLATGKSNANDPSLIEAKEAVPGRYNSQSQLVAEIKPGVNTADFDLKSN